MAHPLAQRLIYAADVNFDDCTNNREAHVKAATFLESTLQALQGLGIIIKGNTLLRVLGMTAIPIIEASGCKVFADYKLFDVQDTIANDASWMRLFPGIKILTVAEDVHPKVFAKLERDLPDVLIAPVNPLTDLTDAEFARRGEQSRIHATAAFFSRVTTLSAKGVICAPSDLRHAPAQFAVGRTIITPGIRPTWSKKPGDTNAVNALTPREAIIAGADCLVVGSPIRINNDLRGNTLRILDEITEAVEERAGH